MVFDWGGFRSIYQGIKGLGGSRTNTASTPQVRQDVYLPEIGPMTDEIRRSQGQTIFGTQQKQADPYSTFLKQEMARSAQKRQILGQIKPFQFDEDASRRKAQIEFNKYYDTVRKKYMKRINLRKRGVTEEYGQTMEGAGLTKEKGLKEAALGEKETMLFLS